MADQQIVWLPENIACGATVFGDAVGENAVLWNEKVFGAENFKNGLKNVQILALGASQVRIQVGLRADPPAPMLDFALADQTFAAPISISIPLGVIPLPAGKQVVVRIAAVGGLFPGNVATAGAILEVES